MLLKKYSPSRGMKGVCGNAYSTTRSSIAPICFLVDVTISISADKLAFRPRTLLLCQGTRWCAFGLVSQRYVTLVQCKRDTKHGAWGLIVEANWKFGASTSQWPEARVVFLCSWFAVRAKLWARRRCFSMCRPLLYGSFRLVAGKAITEEAVTRS